MDGKSGCKARVIGPSGHATNPTDGPLASNIIQYRPPQTSKMEGLGILRTGHKIAKWKNSMEVFVFADFSRDF